MLADAEREETSSSLTPAVERESLDVMKTVGDLAGKGAIASGLTALALPFTAPVTAPLAVGLGSTSAGMYVAEGLTDARQGRTKEGAAKVGLGLVEGALTKPYTPQKDRILFSKTLMGRLGEKVKPYTRGVLEDVAVNIAQDKLREQTDKPKK